MIRVQYSSPELSQEFVPNDNEIPKHTDVNAATEPSDSTLGKLRRDVINVQCQINQFLTERMNHNTASEQADGFEKDILDGDDGIEPEE